MAKTPTPAPEAKIEDPTLPEILQAAAAPETPVAIEAVAPESDGRYLQPGVIETELFTIVHN